MKVLIAADKFKGSLSAREVCNALQRGMHSVENSIEIITRPLADGGDGSLEVLKQCLKLETMKVRVKDPLFRDIPATYQMTKEIAYIEMAAASGLVLLSEEERSAIHTTSYGTGQLIRDALHKGAKQIYLFIGGSATNDGGMGIANALGYEFYDEHDNLLIPIGENLKHIQRIEKQSDSVDLASVDIQVVCDVKNPLYGKMGAAYVYAPQKGANVQEAIALDEGLRHLSLQLIRHGYPDIAQTPGAGAAGGVGGGAIAFLGARLISGTSFFLNFTDTESFMKTCDWVITGEGKLDEQSVEGKVVNGVCALAKKYNKPVIAVCGDADPAAAAQLGITKLYTILSRSASLEDAMLNAGKKLEEIGKELGELQG